MMPSEKAKSIFRNALFFTKDFSMAYELCLFIINSHIDYCKKMHDKAYWIEVKLALDANNKGTL